MERRAISVVVADDEPHVVEYLRMVLHMEGFDVAGTAADADAAVQLADRMHPDVVLLDLRMPGGGLEAARLIGSMSPDTHIVVFSADADAPEILPLLQAGIDGYVVKGAPPERLGEAIREAVSGGSYLAPQVSRAAVGALTARLQSEEQDVLRKSRAHDRMADIIAGARFKIVYQPVVDLRTGRAAGAEALTRFTATPTRPPDQWFEEADQVGMRASLELATAGVALRALGDLEPDLALSVNVSPATVLSGRLGEVLLGVDLDRVVLELTEHAPVADYPGLMAALDPWRRQGARLAVDDAGGGYASFAHILSLHPDYIKRDASLVRDIHLDQQRQALARAVVGFADELGVAIVAEGIEVAAEQAVLVELGAAYGQGFHLGRPRPLDEQPELLARARLDTTSWPLDLRDVVVLPQEAEPSQRPMRP
jgi:EAL domain-containing protein (putative c-di-GMP-specific phosphodiesterase class I)/DNA-binding NarL/FixJ family response regulator